MRRFFVVKPLAGIIGGMFFGFGLIVPILLIKENIFIGGTLLLLGIYTFYKLIIYNSFLRKIEFSAEGLRFTAPFIEHFLSWHEIKTIGVSDIFIGRPGRKPWIYFSTDEQPLVYVKGDMINDRFLMMNYRKEAIEEIKKYWDKDIINLYKGKLR